MPSDIVRRRRARAEEVIPASTLNGNDPTTEAVPAEPFKFLDRTHPDWDANVERWETNMRRAEGGDLILSELWRFDWETQPAEGGLASRRIRQFQKDALPTEESLEAFAGEHYLRRMDAATPINFMDAFAAETVGHLMREAPAPGVSLSFGTLGEVRRKEDIDLPSRAELIYYSADGTGTESAQWDTFWAAAAMRAMHTGYRLIYVEAPATAPILRGRELTGLRPWLVEFDPRDMVNWSFKSGAFQWAVLKLHRRDPIVNAEGDFDGNEGQEDFLLLVRQGVTQLGPQFREGGWWRFDHNKVLLGHRTWQGTRGEIPLTPLVYNRDKTGFGKPGTTELGNAAVALMNIASAADFDAFDTAGAIQFLEGVDAPGFNLAIEKIHKGNRYVPLRNNQETGKTPSARDGSQSGAAGDTFSKRIASILETVDRIRGQVLTSGPSASGLAQQGGFTQMSVPRLALFAANIEACQNAVIQHLEERWGEKKPSGSVKWTRKYKLIQLTTAAQSVLQLCAIAEVHSDKLDQLIILSAAQDEGFVPDTQTKTTIENELMASAKQRTKNIKLAAVPKPGIPAVPTKPGSRKRNMPPEPAQTNNPTPNQLDGPEVA